MGVVADHVKVWTKRLLLVITAPPDATYQFGPWTECVLRVTRLTCARCGKPFDDGERVWTRGSDIIHDRCKS